MTNTHVPERFKEIDVARGLAVIMMVLFHVAFDLFFLGIAPIPVNTLPWRLFAMSTASLFLFLVGISLAISADHARKVLPKKEFYMKYLKRGLGIFTLGMAITLVTWVILPGYFIVFGILHLIGFAISLSPFYTGYTWQTLIAGTAVVLVGFVIASVRGSWFLVWMGIHPAEFYSIDYTPIFPWLGIVLIGVSAGRFLYPEGVRRWDVPLLHFRGKFFSFLGRHSLTIYLFHQPLILGILFIFFPERVISVSLFS